MSERPGMLTARRRGSGALPGMAPAVAVAVEQSGSASGGSAGSQVSADAATSSAQQELRAKEARRAGPRPRQPAAHPGASGRADASASGRIAFGGAQKVTVSTRTYRPLWDAYNELALELTSEGRGRVFQNDLLNAVLAVCLPENPDAARECLARYRALLEADPPRNLRTVS